MKKLIKSKLFLQVIVASMVATLATAGIVGAVTTIGSNISTGGTLTATATSTLNGIVVDTTKFIVEDGSGNTSIGGTLGVAGISAFTGAITFAGTASTTGAAILQTATINSETGAISFGDENLTTTGTLAAGATSLGTLAANATTITGSLTATTKIGIASSTPGAMLSVGPTPTVSSATSTIDFSKPCFKMATEDGTALYLYLKLNANAYSNWATSTTSCF